MCRLSANAADSLTLQNSAARPTIHRMKLSDNVGGLEASATMAVTAACKAMRAEGREVIDLSAGEPDFRTPDFAAQAGISAIVQGLTHYTPVAGIPELRKAIAGQLANRSGVPVDPARVVVTIGAKHALFNACFTLFGPGDRVLVPSPYWTSYPDIVRLARAEPVLVEATAADGFKVTPALLERQYDPRARGLILNSPNNPTGAVYSRLELSALVSWALEHELWILSDEIYGRICFTAPRATSVLDLGLDQSLVDHIVLIDGASKAFAMTGWRIGFSYSSPALASKMSALQSHMTSNASSPAQYAALAAYEDDPRAEEAVKAMVATFGHRRDRVLDALRQHLPEAEVVPPDGAFYLFFRADAYYRDDVADSVSFCMWLLEQAGVALVPGAAFGDDRFVRLSFAASEDALMDGIRRIGEAVAVAVAD